MIPTLCCRREAPIGNLGVDLALGITATKLVPSVEVSGSSDMMEMQTTQVEQPSDTRPCLESYAPSLARAREAWSMPTVKATEFDSIFKVSHILLII